MNLTPETECSVIVKPQDRGGIDVEIRVPTCDGGTVFTVTVERSTDGDWAVFLPSSADTSDDPVVLDNGTEVLNGIAYIGAPDCDVKARWERV